MIRKVKKDWGKEEWIVNNELYCFKKIYVNEGCECSIHWHKNKDETFYIAKGHIVLELFGVKPIHMYYGDTYRLTPYTTHRFFAKEDSIIYEISTHHEDSDSYRVVKGGKVDNYN
jgi:mannose-6-phosphate isomerase-like protein (cupin superfamily)